MELSRSVPTSVCVRGTYFTIAFGTVLLSSWPRNRSQVYSSLSFAYLSIIVHLKCYCYWISKLFSKEVAINFSPFLHAGARTQGLICGNVCYTTELEPQHFKVTE